MGKGKCSKQTSEELKFQNLKKKKKEEEASTAIKQ